MELDTTPLGKCKQYVLNHSAFHLLHITISDIDDGQPSASALMLEAIDRLQRSVIAEARLTRAQLQSNEAKSVRRHSELIMKYNICKSHKRRAQNRQIVSELVEDDGSEDLNLQIKSDFIAPDWPLKTSDDIIQFNKDLTQTEFRDNVVNMCLQNVSLNHHTYIHICE